MREQTVTVYTDGSCHTQLLHGAWAAIIFIENEKVILQGLETDTTHNRMELQAVINAILYIDKRGLGEKLIHIYSDSQYVVNLTGRIHKLRQKQFITSKGTAIQNQDLVRQLIALIESHNIHFTKVKAHQKDGDELNREVDIIVRKLLRKNYI